MMLQAFAWNAYHADPNEVAPTLAEELNMAYQAAINGANGLLWYYYQDLKREAAPDLNTDGSLERVHGPANYWDGKPILKGGLPTERDNVIFTPWHPPHRVACSRPGVHKLTRATSPGVWPN